MSCFPCLPKKKVEKDSPLEDEKSLPGLSVGTPKAMHYSLDVGGHQHDMNSPDRMRHSMATTERGHASEKMFQDAVHSKVELKEGHYTVHHTDDAKNLSDQPLGQPLGKGRLPSLDENRPVATGAIRHDSLDMYGNVPTLSPDKNRHSFAAPQLDHAAVLAQDIVHHKVEQKEGAYGVHHTSDKNNLPTDSSNNANNLSTETINSEHDLPTDTTDNENDNQRDSSDSIQRPVEESCESSDGISAGNINNSNVPGSVYGLPHCSEKRITTVLTVQTSPPPAGFVPAYPAGYPIACQGMYKLDTDGSEYTGPFSNLIGVDYQELVRACVIGFVASFLPGECRNIPAYFRRN